MLRLTAPQCGFLRRNCNRSFCIRWQHSASPLKRLPAGISNIAAFLNTRENFFYVNKAPFIPVVEEAANVTLLLRPKRWGKTSFLNLLAAYYDSSHAAAPLVRIPGGDTRLAGGFTVVKFDVANVARALSSAVTATDIQAQTRRALDAELHRAVVRTITRYKIPGIDTSQPYTELLEKLGDWAASQGAPLYFFVDDYDAVLRTFAISSGSHSASALAGSQGPLREFFGRFKFLLDSGIVDRVFATGEYELRARVCVLCCFI
jgi:hypothetical protein